MEKHEATNINDDDMIEYLAGNKLYGDDFRLEEIQKWFEDEKEAYANLGAKNCPNYSYAYHELNRRLGFRYLPKRRFTNVLGFGSAYGDEFLPLISKIQKITIIEPSDVFKKKQIHSVPVNYIKPEIDGSIPFPNNQFDLITCFGVLHHIPNVSYVLKELARCLMPGGYLLIREPIVSLGEWSSKRQGLTKRERGIPLKIFRRIIDMTSLKVIQETKCNFSAIRKVASCTNIAANNSKILTWLDVLICSLFSWDINYHTHNILRKFKPTAVYYVLFKRA